MSFCRWSTPNCDLYCYEHVNGYYVTWVAECEMRKLFEYLLEKFSYFPNQLWVPRWIIFKKISLSEDGKEFVDYSMQDFYNRIEWLNKKGYKIPEYLLPQIEEEIKQRETY